MKHNKGTHKKKLRALLVSPSSVDRYPPVQYQARLLADNGVRVHLLSAPIGAETKIKFSYPGVKVYRFLAENPSKWVRLFSLLHMAVWVTLIRLYHKPAMEIDFDPIGVVVGKWARGRAKALIHHHHEVLFNDNRGRHIPKARAALPEADLVTVADEGRRKLLMSEEPAPRQSLTIRNVPMASDVVPNAGARANTFTVVYFGSVGPAQCLDSVIRSMCDWPKQTCLHIYGAKKTEYVLELEALAESLGVSERFILKPWVATSDLLKEISQYHLALTLLRPLNDNWRFSAGASNKRFLAMAATLPQISDNGIGVTEIVEQTGSGICVDPTDPSAIAAAINAYAFDPERVENDGENGRNLIINGLNYEREFDPIIEMIKTERLPS